ncbi:hypothetical protein SVAN01_02381 [Stagonosporopsis vannaccii]|nr:hypothetical protein SVAN01_02381 [Stagonosporopsis vannaccii]
MARHRHNTAFRHFMPDTRLGCSRGACRRQNVEGLKRVTHSQERCQRLALSDGGRLR